MARSITAIVRVNRTRRVLTQVSRIQYSSGFSSEFVVHLLFAGILCGHVFVLSSRACFICGQSLGATSNGQRHLLYRLSCFRYDHINPSQTHNYCLPYICSAHNTVVHWSNIRDFPGGNVIYMYYRMHDRVAWSFLLMCVISRR